jgi:hypothetical protein
MARRTNPERRAQIAEMLARGLGLAEISRMLDVSISTVWHYACGLGYKPDPKFSRRYDWREVQRYYDAGHPSANAGSTSASRTRLGTTPRAGATFARGFARCRLPIC